MNDKNAWKLDMQACEKYQERIVTAICADDLDYNLLVLKIVLCKLPQSKQPVNNYHFKQLSSGSEYIDGKHPPKEII